VLPALVWIALGVLAARLASAVLPAQVALAVGVMVVIGVPGGALLRASGLASRLDGPQRLAVLPLAGLAAWAVPLAAAMLVHVSLGWLVGTVLALSAIGSLAERPRLPRWMRGERPLLAAAAALAAVVASRWQPPLLGDALFHAGRVRKLVDLPELSLQGASAFLHAYPHAGYVFPLLHAVQAAAIEITGLEPSAAYPDLAPAFGFMLVPAVYGAGRSLAGPAVGASAAGLALWDAVSRGGGQIGAAEQPPTFTFVVLVPATVALVAAAWARPDDRRLRAAVVVAVTVIAVVHATYAVVPLAVIAAAVVVSRRGWLTLAASAGAVAVVFALIWWLALRGGAHTGGRAVTATDFVLWQGRPVALQASLIVHDRPEFLVALLAVVPLLVLWRGRHVFAAALMAGALALTAFPGAMALIESVFGAGQARRLWDGIPWQPVAALAVAALAARLGGVGIAVLAGVSIAVARIDGPWYSTALPIAVAIAATAVMVWLMLRRPVTGVAASPGAGVSATLLATLALLAGSISVNASAVRTTLLHGPRPPENAQPRLPAGLIGYMRAHDHTAPFPVVLAEPYAAYQLVGQADVYVVALPEERTRAEPRNQPRTRRDSVGIFLSPGTSDAARRVIMQRYGVSYVVVNTGTAPRAVVTLRADPDLRPVYSTGGWVVFRRLR
jgi:hypothetical protein